MRKETILFILLITLVLVHSVSAETFYPSNNIWPGGAYQTAILPSAPPYAYQANGAYTAYFSSDPTSGNGIKLITAGGNQILFQPNPLNWRNDNNDLQQVSQIQSVSGVPNNNVMNYPDAYGAGISLSYTAQVGQVKELLTISTAGALPTPAAYVLASPGVVLELTFNFAADDKIIVDGVEWDKSSTVITNNTLEVRDEFTDEILYTLDRPLAWDSAGNSIQGSFQLKKAGNKLYIGQRIPYSFIQTATYPVFIDPTFTVDFSPIPGQHLINGTVNESLCTEFDAMLDITTEISDDLDGTVADTFRGLLESNFPESARITLQLDETSGSTAFDLSGQGNDGTLNGGTVQGVTGVAGTAYDFDGVNDYVSIPSDSSFFANSTEDLIVCVAINTNQTLSGGGGTAGIFDADDVNDGWEIKMDSNQERPYLGIDRASFASIQSNTAINDGVWHTICGYGLANTTMGLFVDGTQTATGTSSSGGMTADSVSVGTTQDLNDFFEGNIDEACIWIGEGLDHDTIIASYETDYCGGINNSKGRAISAVWNETHDPAYQWFLRVRKQTSGTHNFTTFAYADNITINTSQIATASLAGTGWFNINVSSLLDYQLNTALLNYSKLRLFTELEANFSEVRLRKEINDSEVPVITNCGVNTTSLNCSESALFSCNATDNLDVANVTFTIQGEGTVNTTQTMNNYSYVLSPSGINTTVLYNWTLVNATDILGNSNTTNPSVTVNYTCFTPPTPPDLSPPLIINPTAINITNQSATIIWDTNETANSTVEYGLTLSLGSVATDGSFVLNHSINLTSLFSNITYFYNVTSCDPSGNCATAGVFNFTTLANPPPPVPTNISDGINCTFNTNPLTSEEAFFDCTLNESTGVFHTCFGLTVNPETQLVLDVMPRPEAVALHGLTTGYESTPKSGSLQKVKVYFSYNRLKGGADTGYHVQCVNNQTGATRWYNKTLQPDYRTLYVTGSAAESVTDSASYIVGGIIFFGILLFIILLVLFGVFR